MIIVFNEVYSWKCFALIWTHQVFPGLFTEIINQDRSGDPSGSVVRSRDWTLNRCSGFDQVSSVGVGKGILM